MHAFESLDPETCKIIASKGYLAVRNITSHISKGHILHYPELANLQILAHVVHAQQHSMHASQYQSCHLHSVPFNFSHHTAL